MCNSTVPIQLKVSSRCHTIPTLQIIGVISFNYILHSMLDRTLLCIFLLYIILVYKPQICIKLLINKADANRHYNSYLEIMRCHEVIHCSF